MIDYEQEQEQQEDPSSGIPGFSRRSKQPDDLSRAIAPLVDAAATKLRNPEPMPLKGNRDIGQSILAGLVSSVATYYYGVPGAGGGGVLGAMAYPFLRDMGKNLFIPAATGRARRKRK